MVKFTSSLLIAASVAPAFSAPIQFGTREPKINVAALKRAGHIASPVLSGTADTAMSVATIKDAASSLRSSSVAARDFDKFDTREPKVTAAGLKKVGAGIKHAGHTANHAISTTANTANNVATITSSIQHVIKSLRDSDELDTREPKVTTAGLKKAGAGIKHAGHTANHAISTTANTANNVATIASSIQHVISAVKSLRDFDVLDTREPKVTAAGLKRVGHTTNHALSGAVDTAMNLPTIKNAVSSTWTTARDFDDLNARELTSLNELD
jgi:3-oxoacyl-(acyl-carrier-protein) synthase